MILKSNLKIWMLPSKNFHIKINKASRFFALAFFLLILLASCSNDFEKQEVDTLESEPSSVRAIVIKVKDGDSVILRYADFIEKEARLYGIDAPEYNQAYGKQAKRTLEKLVLKKFVLVDVKDTDRYQREIVIMNREGDRLNVNLELIKVGSAWVYSQYQDDKIWNKAESSARQQGLGLWELNNPVPPWIWRRK